MFYLEKIGKIVPIRSAMTNLSRRDFLKLASLTAASTSLAACLSPDETISAPTTAHGARPGQSQGGLSPSAAPVEPVPPENLPDLATIVFGRLAFGARPGEREAFHSLGATDEARLQAWVEAQLHPATLDDSEFEARYKQAGFETLHKSLEQLYTDHIVNNPYSDNDDRRWQWFVLPSEELVEATLLRAVYSHKQLQELLADFWHNHFNVYGWDEELTPAFTSYDRDVIRAHLFGNFRQFLEAMASHPAMLYYLNNRSNSDAGPNENFARELFELHTLGAEHYIGVRDPAAVEKDADGIAIGYVDNDVYEAARCFTGWRVDDDLWEGDNEVGVSGAFIYYRPWHDRFNKIVLGKYLPADQPDMQDGRDVLDLLASHPGTALHISRKLCRRFISDYPPESIVQAAAQVFLDAKDAPDQLRQVYRAIFLSPEFRAAWGGKLKRPFEFATSVLRALNADFTRPPGGVRWFFRMFGQPLFEHHPPTGYPDTAEAWANTMTTLYGWNFITGVTENWMTDDQHPERILRVDLRAETPAELRSAAALVDYWLNRIYGRPLPAEMRLALIDFLRENASAEEELPEEHLNWRLSSTIALALMFPEMRLR